MPAQSALRYHPNPVTQALQARLAALLQDARTRLPVHEARALLAHAAGLAPADLISNPAQKIDPTLFHALLARRLAGEPLQFLLGHTGFWTLDLEVSPATLIPRPDSETIVEAALAHAQAPTGQVLDLGTGTGCLLLAFLTERPGWFGIGADLSPEAAALARRNAARANLSARTSFLAAHWADPLAGNHDLVLSNPPYIPHASIQSLAPEVRDWEPASALDGGPDGLNAYRALIADLPRLLAPGGIAVLELGFGQAEPVSRIARHHGLAIREARPDLAAIPRALVLRRE